MNHALQPPAWYGKLPGAGDFVSRRLSAEVIHWWAHWLQRSLQEQNERYPGWQQRYVRAPLWNFMIPPTWDMPELQLGSIAPSCDRVGRCYPLCLLLPLDSEQVFDTPTLAAAFQELEGRGQQLLEGIRRGLSPEQLDQELTGALQPQAIANSHSWPELAQYLQSDEPTSFWWTHSASSGPTRRHVHHGALNALLFNQLFDGLGSDAF
ncbi:type VI secretion system-associated protein TagF [Pseudomonas nicosulfuronedens]